MVIQIAVFLQPLFAEHFQVASVCKTVALALKLDRYSPPIQHPVVYFEETVETEHQQQTKGHDPAFYAHLNGHVHLEQASSQLQHKSMQHYDGGQCLYCAVLSYSLPLSDSKVKPVLIRIHLRFLAFIKRFAHVYYELLRLFLFPQGRAPPIELYA